MVADPAPEPTRGPTQGSGDEPKEPGASGEERAGPGEERQQGVVGRLFYKLALVGVGGVMLAQDEIADFFRRGEEPRDGARPDASRRGEGSSGERDAAAGRESAAVAGRECATGDDREAPAGAARDGEPRRGDRVDATIDRVLRTLNVPSRADVDDLARQIDRLAERVEALRA